MLVVEQYLNIRLLLKQCPFCLEYLSEKKNKKGENAQKVKKNPASITYHPFFCHRGDAYAIPHVSIDRFTMAFYSCLARCRMFQTLEQSVSCLETVSSK